MIKIMFVCHGNICRSPMAEFICKNMVEKMGLSDKFRIASAATSTEEIGNPVHYGTRQILAKHGISPKGKYAVQMTKADYELYDYIVCMDKNNLRNIKYIIPSDPQNKIFLLMDFVGQSRDVADPWYTGDFETTEKDILNGCEALIKYIIKSNPSLDKTAHIL